MRVCGAFIAAEAPGDFWSSVCVGNTLAESDRIACSWNAAEVR
jgi:hypothetical protein